MSQALWCDIGNHAFSAKDPDREHYTQTKKRKQNVGNSYGTAVYQDQTDITDELDVCGPCVARQGLFSGPQDSIPAKAVAAPGLEEEGNRF